MSLVTMKAQPCTTKVTSVIMHENPPSRWHHGNGEEQRKHTERVFFCRQTSTVQEEKIIRINMYIYTKCDAEIN